MEPLANSEGTETFQSPEYYCCFFQNRLCASFLSWIRYLIELLVQGGSVIMCVCFMHNEIT